MAGPHSNLYADLQALFASRAQARDAAAAAAGGASITDSGGDYVEVAVTPEELTPELKEALNRTMALVAGTTNARDTRIILQDHYARFAVYETNLLWCPHSVSIAAWMGAARMLLMPYVEGIRCHRIVLRRVPASSTGVSGSAPAAQQHAEQVEGMEGAGPLPTTSPEVNMQMQLDVAFAWKPLAPVHGLLMSWGAKGLQMPTFTTEHTITLTVHQQNRVVAHKDITHNFPSVPPFLKGLLGLPTPLVATILHV